ncbi:hypothetical protein [uncultured Xanthomonas sp.]|uniref:hypothetical protein n=1 Tax=uncultured Xanthomonas sp. TaxID=152831 RepID=UPI0025F3B8B4|nr:hypothetical protein [uncultured Xanthomonas sp.]
MNDRHLIQSPDIQPTSPSNRYAVVVAFLLVILMVTPWAPAMPFAGLDGSWSYAMNVATAQHMRFGQDIIFTFGPLASIFTRVYHPATDMLMIGGSLLIAVALFAGIWAWVASHRRWLLLWLPVLISFCWGRDALFLFLPLLLPCVASVGVERGRPITMTLALLAAANAILPLVKGNFGVMVGISTIVAILLCWRSSPRSALLIIVVEVGALICAWLLAGQRIGDLPGYFIAQLPIISGYTGAMSVPGRGLDIVVFILAATLLLGVSMLSRLRRHWYLPVLFAAYLFVCFKTGFVRHDGHALTAGMGLAYVGFLFWLGPTSGDGRGPVAFAIGLIGWALIASSYQPVGLDGSVSRFTEMVTENARGAWARLNNSGALQAQFERDVAQLAAHPPFVRSQEPADVYPVELTPLLATGANWKPRPILQSYSAYTPGLVMINAEHLVRNPPSRIYFALSPIDNRYPSLDDGASWPALLGSYTLKQLNSDFAVLERALPTKPPLTPVVQRQVDAVLGEDVVVADSEHPVWVTVDIQPTLLGRLVALLYKLPELSMRVRYVDEATADFRFIPGMARSGFLLSPTVRDAKDFAALSSHYRANLLGQRRVAALSIAGARGTRWLWRHSYRLVFSRLDIPASTSVDEVLAGARTPSAGPSSFAIGGQCRIDEIDGRPVGGAPSALVKPMVVIRGWAALDAEHGRPNQGVRLLMSSGGSEFGTLPAYRVSRPDVARHFNHPELEYSGFEAYVDVRQLPVDSQIQILQKDGDRWLLCSGVTAATHRADGEE